MGGGGGGRGVCGAVVRVQVDSTSTWLVGSERAAGGRRRTATSSSSHACAAETEILVRGAAALRWLAPASCDVDGAREARAGRTWRAAAEMAADIRAPPGG